MIIASNHKFYFSWSYTKRKEIAKSKCLKSKDCLLMLIKTNKIDLPKYYNDWTWHVKKNLVLDKSKSIPSSCSYYY